MGDAGESEPRPISWTARDHETEHSKRLKVKA